MLLTAPLYLLFIHTMGMAHFRTGESMFIPNVGNCWTSVQLHQPNAHILFITYQYHVSPTCFGVSLTIFRENFRVPDPQKRLLLRSYYLWHSGCIIQYKRYNFVGLQ